MFFIGTLTSTDLLFFIVLRTVAIPVLVRSAALKSGGKCAVSTKSECSARDLVEILGYVTHRLIRLLQMIDNKALQIKVFAWNI